MNDVNQLYNGEQIGICVVNGEVKEDNARATVDPTVTLQVTGMNTNKYGTIYYLFIFNVHTVLLHFTNNDENK